MAAAAITGFIRPPPEIRAIVDKTAAFVARNGPEFEVKIRQDKGGDAKFAFLRPDNPYHAYYRHKVEEANAPPAPAPAPVAAAEASPAADGASSSSTSSAAAAAAPAAPAPAAPVVRRADVLPNPLSRALKAVDLNAPPPANEFAVVTPTYAAAETIDVIRLTAQYTAVSGRPFLAGLAARESRNPLFDFLKPTHSLFPFFTACVDAYARTLRPSVNVLERLAVDSTGRGALLQRCVSRYAHAQAEEEKKREEAAAAANDRSALAAIDWHDAVLVETVPFPEDDADELADLPPPLPHPSTLAPVVTSSTGAVVPRLIVKPSAETAVQLATAVAEGLESGAAKAPSLPAAAAASAVAAATAGVADFASAGAREEAMEEEEEGDDDGEQIRVVTNYVPQLPTAPSHAPSMTSYYDPRSGRAIPIEQAGDHLRIETLDPRWLEQRAKHAARQSTTNLLASGDEVADNLRRLAQTRGDIFRGEGGAASAGDAAANEPAAKRARQG